MQKIDKELLQSVADLHDIPQGAYNIRKNGKVADRNTTANIDISTKLDNPGLIIRVKDNTKNESVHIPVIVTESDIHDLVYNDIYVGDNCDVLIVAGCGIHNNGSMASEHNGRHIIQVGNNSRVKYIEKHLGMGKGTGGKILNPETNIVLGENSTLIMETVQLGGVDSSIRSTTASVGNNSKLDISERILTDSNQVAETHFLVHLNGTDSAAKVSSRSVAKGESRQVFYSNMAGNNACFGHVECDAIIMDRATVQSVPEINANDSDAVLTHEAVVGKIAGEQIIKLMTMGLNEQEAEALIISGFLGK